jgi:hypothetical protein
MTAKGRFILRYTGDGAAPDAHVACLRATPGTKVLDEANRMLLVEGCEPDLQAATRALGDWVVTPETTVPVPDTRKKVRGGPA